MDIKLDMHPLKGLGLSVSPPAFGGRAQLLKDGVPLTLNSRKVYVVQDADGNPIDITFKHDFFDAIPQVVVDGQKHSIVEPLKGYEKALVGFPLIFMVAGGLLGFLIGFAGLYVNRHVMRSDKSDTGKYAICTALSLGVLVFFTISAVTVSTAIDNSNLEDFQSADNSKTPENQGINEITTFAAAENVGTPRPLGQNIMLISVSMVGNDIVYRYTLNLDRLPADFTTVTAEMNKSYRDFFCSAPETAQIRKNPNVQIVQEFSSLKGSMLSPNRTIKPEDCR